MNLSYFSEFSSGIYDPAMGDFRSVPGRLFCFKLLIQKIVALPFVLFFRACLTLCRGLGLLFSLALLICTFGTSTGSREFFLRRVIFLAKDIAEWVLLPFTLILGFFKLLFGCTLHPALYFRF